MYYPPSRNGQWYHYDPQCPHIRLYRYIDLFRSLLWLQQFDIHLDKHIYKNHRCSRISTDGRMCQHFSHIRQHRHNPKSHNSQYNPIKVRLQMNKMNALVTLNFSFTNLPTSFYDKTDQLIGFCVLDLVSNNFWMSDSSRFWSIFFNLKIENMASMADFHSASSGRKFNSDCFI